MQEPYGKGLVGHPAQHSWGVWAEGRGAGPAGWPCAALAPGRVVLGVGTGFTGRNTMGLPPLPVAHMVEYIRQVRGLLAGEDVLRRAGKAERWIRRLRRAPARCRAR